MKANCKKLGIHLPKDFIQSLKLVLIAGTKKSCVDCSSIKDVEILGQFLMIIYKKSLMISLFLKNGTLVDQIDFN